MFRFIAMASLVLLTTFNCVADDSEREEFEAMINSIQSGNKRTTFHWQTGYEQSGNYLYLFRNADSSRFETSSGNVAFFYVKNNSISSEKQISLVLRQYVFSNRIHEENYVTCELRIDEGNIYTYGTRIVRPDYQWQALQIDFWLMKDKSDNKIVSSDAFLNELISGKTLRIKIINGPIDNYVKIDLEGLSSELPKLLAKIGEKNVDADYFK